MTGHDYYEYWKDGGEAGKSDTLNDFIYQGGRHEGFETHKDDTEGHWYGPICQYDAPASVRDPYQLRPAIYVMAGETPPVTEVQVDPEVLAQMARDAMDLPEGTVRWNPSLVGSGATVVNTDTWVWLDGADVTISVTAAIPSGLAATVTADLAHLTLSAPGYAPRTECAGAGTPWTAGATSTDCSLLFTRSTANGSSAKLPTTTITATAAWTATWNTTADATPRAIAVDPVTTTAEIPVAEIQSIVTRG
jgi:hypothetical protein